jgi:formamidopyrimidine-DNA glycosylase
MPELPEVETIRQCVEGRVGGKTVREAVVRNPNLRWPVPGELPDLLAGRTVRTVDRRGKYLLLRCEGGTVLIHLGMSGRLLVRDLDTPLEKHDHVDIVFEDRTVLRLNDTRRFGCVLWTEEDPLEHPLLERLGPEPLENGFNGRHLFERSRNRIVMVKSFIMDSRVVVGVGNIYANEALFAAGIRPDRECGRISRKRYDRLAAGIKEVLQRAIDCGGTTFRDYCDAEGNPGSFALDLMVYNRAGEPCRACGATVQGSRLGQRATYYCPRCQR